MKTKTYYLFCDLKEDETLIAEYKEHHKQVWPEVLQSIADSGIISMKIFNKGNRLFMIIEASESFTFQNKAEMDAANPTVKEWEQLMWNYQQKIPFSKENEKWVVLDEIFSFSSNENI